MSSDASTVGVRDFSVNVLSCILTYVTYEYVCLDNIDSTRIESIWKFKFSCKKLQSIF